MGNFNSKSISVYVDVRLSRDAKHFEAKGDKKAATMLSFYYQTKNGKDLPVDAQVVYGAQTFAGLKKGDIVTITAPKGLAIIEHEKYGIQGKIYDAQVATQVNLKARGSAEPPPAAESEASDVDDAPAFT